MTAKEYLQQLYKADTIINQKLKEKDDLHRMSTNIGGLDYTKEKIQTSSPENAPYETMIQKMIDIEGKIYSEVNYFLEKKHLIINQIQGLKNEKHINVLYLRYVEFKNFENIAVEMGLSYQYMLELHGYALQEFEKTYKNLLKPIKTYEFLYDSYFN